MGTRAAWRMADSNTAGRSSEALGPPRPHLKADLAKPIAPAQGPGQALSELLEHTSRAMHASCFAYGLNPAQWNALRYLQRANESGRTLSGFAKNQMTSKSTASETLAALLAKGLVQQRAHPNDRRARLFEVTGPGRDLLDRDPLSAIGARLGQLSPDHLLITAETLREVARSLYRPNLSARG